MPGRKGPRLAAGVYTGGGGWVVYTAWHDRIGTGEEGTRGGAGGAGRAGGPMATGGAGQVRVPRDGGARFRAVFGRALRRRCPYCGGGGLFRAWGWFDLREVCPTCGTRFEREHGYFLGATALNLVIPEFAAFGILVAFWLTGDRSLLALEVAALVPMLLLPVLFFPWSRTLWMALDLQLHPPDSASA